MCIRDRVNVETLIEGGYVSKNDRVKILGNGTLSKAVKVTAHALDVYKRQVETDEGNGQTIIRGMGELHLDIIVDRLNREFGVEINQGQPQVNYKEALTAPVEHREVFKNCLLYTSGFPTPAGRSPSPFSSRKAVELAAMPSATMSGHVSSLSLIHICTR